MGQENKKHSRFHVGDLVTVKEHCRHSGRVAILVDVVQSPYSQACKIQWVDDLKSPPTSALLTNLEEITVVNG
jgi:hypothetical protein